MAQSKALTVDEYIAGLSTERHKAIATLRQVVLNNLPEGYMEMMQYGMIGYSIPLSRYPNTYNGQPLSYAALASHKQYMSLYLMNVYGDPETEDWFIERYKAAGKKLSMGKSCVRFKSLQDLPIGLIGEVIARTPVSKFVERYEASRHKTNTQG